MVTQDEVGHKNPGAQKAGNSVANIGQQVSDGQVVFIIGILSGRMTAVLAVLMALTGAVAQAQSKTGPVTNMPIPRYVSLKAGEGNVRRGPSLTHRIDWVFKRRNMPLQVTGEHGHWRRVMDRDGAGGWVHYALLSGVRTVIVEKDMLPLHTRPDPQTPVVAALELGVVARLGDCNVDWCSVSVGGYRGWTRKQNLWGVAPDEIRD